MTRHLILLVCSAEPRLQARHALTRAAGYLPLSASTMSRAIFLLQKVRPSLVVTDVELSDGRAPVLLRHMRGVKVLERVRVIVLGALAAPEHAHVARDPYAAVRQLDDEEALTALLDEELGGARSFSVVALTDDTNDMADPTTGLLVARSALSRDGA